MKIDKVKAAVIGCGMISEIYFKNLTQLFSIVQIVGCSDLCEQKALAAAEKYQIKVMTNKQIFEYKAIEMVINLTYASSHYEVTKAALEAGKHVYSEKMMAINYSEAMELYNLAKRKNLYLSVAPDTILGASTQTCRRIIDSGIIGEPVMVTGRLTRGYHLTKTSEEDKFRKFSVMHKGGGIPYDMGGYYLHTLFYLLGPISKAGGFIFTRNANRKYLNPLNDKYEENFTVETPNTMNAVFKMRSGVSGSLDITSEGFGGTQELIIHGTNAILYLGDPNCFGDKVYIETKSTPKCELPLIYPYQEDSRGIGAAETAWSIRKGRKQRLISEFGLHAMEFIDALLSSEKEGVMVNLNTNFERPAPFSFDYYGGSSNENILAK